MRRVMVGIVAVLVITLVICLVLAPSISVVSAAVGTWSIPQFTGDYPSSPKDPPLIWTEQLNGIAHDDNNWFFTTTGPCRIMKFPVGLDLTDDTNFFFPPPLEGVKEVGDGIVVSWDVPDGLSDLGSYDHYGDLDQVGGFLFVPVEGDNPMAVAVFRASDLSYVGANYLADQGWAGWVAYNSTDNCLYSSNSWIDPTEGNWLYRYTVDFPALESGTLVNGLLVNPATGEPAISLSTIQPRVELRNGDGSPLSPPLGYAGPEVAYMQGGTFTPWGDLYLVNGDCSTGTSAEDQHGGIHLFRPVLGYYGMKQFWRVADSENGATSFNFEWHPVANGDEPEGIDWWNRSIGPASPNITEQLHVILLDTENGPDLLYLKHYNVNIPPTADAGPDQTAKEGDQVMLSGTFTDPDGPSPYTFLWHLNSSTNGQLIPDSTNKSLSFVPNDNGVYFFSFTVADNNGAPGTDTVMITALNLPPVVGALYISNQPNEEFILPVVHDIYFWGEFTDAGTADTHTAVWDWGDGTKSDGNVTETNGSGHVTEYHTYSLPGDYTVTLVVTDDDGGQDSNTMIVHVADVDEALGIFNDYVQYLPNSRFKNSADQRKGAFDSMFVSLNHMLAVEDYHGMILSLNSNIRSKFDGLVGGSPKDDWIVRNLTTQEDLCQKVDDITSYLQYLMSTMP